MELVSEAIAFAVKAHDGMRRKKSEVPYILHPMEAAVIVGTMTDDQNLIAAAALHDVVEDTDTTIEDVKHFCMNNGRQIVISSSGDFSKGFSSVLSKFYIPNDKVSVLACGYLPENSLGWKIKNGFKDVEIGGINRKVRCEFKGTIPSLSGHATHQGLIDFTKSLNQSVLKDIILVHGTDEAKQDLKEDLEKELGSNKKIHIIKQFETLKF